MNEPDDVVDPDAFAKGRAQATEDLSAGKLIIRRHGNPGPWGDDYVKLMKDRLRCDVEDSAGCIVDQTIVSFDEGYNEVMLAEIERHRGAKAHASTLEEAKRSAQIRHDEYRRNNR